jgi:hypothetical protein
MDGIMTRSPGVSARVSCEKCDRTNNPFSRLFLKLDAEKCSHSFQNPLRPVYFSGNDIVLLIRIS